MKTGIGLEQARNLIWEHLGELACEQLGLDELVGRVLGADILALVDCPDSDVSRKDGFAVVSADLSQASPGSPVSLEVIGSVNAGGDCDLTVSSGQAVRITTGARLPRGAQAVLAEEFSQPSPPGTVLCSASAEPGRNVLERATDLQEDQTIARAGQRLDPGLMGLLAAAGIDQAQVVRLPRVALLATGDEIVAPGHVLGPGQVYASNLTELSAWLRSYGIPHTSQVVRDDGASLSRAIGQVLPEVDVVLTAGGAWTSEKDLILSVLEEMDWQGVFHRVRLGPGKGTAFGLLQDRPVFCLPGGPPSCEMAFLNLALPAIVRLAGWRESPFARLTARLSEPVSGQSDWTQALHATLDYEQGVLWARPCRLPSRLVSMARAQAMILLPEGVARFEAGQDIELALLSG